MRVQSVAIHGLFGMFEHRIPLFTRDPITIITGPNGVGKTSILRLIYGALKPDYLNLRQIPFSQILIEFEQGSQLCISPVDARPEPPLARTRRSLPSIRFQLLRNGREMEDYIHEVTEASARLVERIDQFLPFLHRVGPQEWHDSSTDGVMSFDEVVHHYGDDLPRSLRIRQEPDWLKSLQADCPIHFIETQRLLDVRRANPYKAQQSHTESAVKRCSDDFARLLESRLAESATLSQRLERSFPTRLIRGAGPAPLAEQAIRESLAKIDERRSRLASAGLLDPAAYEPPLPQTEFDETIRRVLSVYIVDTNEKLAIFDDYLDRIELMKDIVNNRFLFKSLEISRERGFVLKTREGRNVALSDLSSGEQHELVLLYELLFRAKQNTLILIDEPELSLHIAWQQQFLRDLVRIAKLVHLQALVATHSPQIIHDRWDLAIELTGPPA